MVRIRFLLAPLLWVLGFQLVSGFIGFVTKENLAGWYNDLAKPDFTPPNFIFPIAWISLYVMISLAGYLAFKSFKDGHSSYLLPFIFVVYALLNWAWSIIFFEFHMLELALWWVVAINIVNVIFIILAWTRARMAAFLMAPPLVWTSFAAVLTYEIWRLN